MGTFIDGIGASQNIDSSGEIVDIAGLDISSLEVDGSLNWEHKKDVPDQLVGKVLKARKIFSKKDCEDDRQLHFWEKCQIPYLYILGELFDDYTDSARTVAGLFRYDADHRGKNERDVVGFSVEGAKLPGAQNGMTITRSIARKITITNFPANKMATAEMVPKENKKPKDNIDNIFKTESLVEIEVINMNKHSDIWDLLKKEASMRKLKDAPLKKDIGAGGMAYGSSTGLTGSAPSSPSFSCSEPDMGRSEDMAKAANLKMVGPKGTKIGTTSTGKDIHSHARVGETGFNAEEHSEAAKAHQKAAVSSSDPKLAQHHHGKAALHNKAVVAIKDKVARRQAAARNSAASSPGIKHGKLYNPRLSGTVNYKKSEVLGPGKESDARQANQKQERARRAEEAYPNNDKRHFDEHKINHSPSNIGNVKRPSIPNKQVAPDAPAAGGPRNNMLHNNILAPKFTNHKSENLTKAGVGGGGFGGASTISNIVTSTAPAPKEPKKMPLGKITKSLEAGSSLASPDRLTGGAALGKESLEKDSKDPMWAPKDRKVKQIQQQIDSGTYKHPDSSKVTDKIINHPSKPLKKSAAYMRAEADYANWNKREEFEAFMKSRMPHMTKGEIRAFGQAMLLNKSLRLEKSLDFKKK